MVASEIELKFRVSDIALLRESILAAGFTVETSRTLERNTLYDTPERELRAKRQVLRIRQYGETFVLTHKRPTSEDLEQQLRRFKFRQESETEVADGETLNHVFIELGYAPVFRYEKYRTEFTDGTGKIVLDETPIGIFAEAEGDTEWIDHTLAKLGINSEACFTDSYGRLFELWQAETGSPARDMTFSDVEVTA